jgi:hypothetical protein
MMNSYILVVSCADPFVVVLRVYIHIKPCFFTTCMSPIVGFVFCETSEEEFASIDSIVIHTKNSAYFSSVAAAFLL